MRFQKLIIGYLINRHPPKKTPFHGKKRASSSVSGAAFVESITKKDGFFLHLESNN
jgi:hypothetical protein